MTVVKMNFRVFTGIRRSHKSGFYPLNICLLNASKVCDWTRALCRYCLFVVSAGTS